MQFRKVYEWFRGDVCNYSLLLFLPYTAGYGLIGHLRKANVAIRCAIDEKLPFVKWFIIPYTLWYAYAASTLIWFYLKEKGAYLKLMATFFEGLMPFLMYFLFFPNRIDFRPAASEIPGNDILARMVRFIYRIDEPTNVCPSIHCYISLVLLFAIRESESLKDHARVRYAAAVLSVLICMSTVLLKQHSVIDVAAGTALAVLIHWLIWHTPLAKKLEKSANAALTRRAGKNAEASNCQTASGSPCMQGN